MLKGLLKRTEQNKSKLITDQLILTALDKGKHPINSINSDTNIDLSHYNRPTAWTNVITQIPTNVHHNDLENTIHCQKMPV